MKSRIILFTILVLAAVSLGSCSKAGDPEAEVPEELPVGLPLPEILSVTVVEKSISDFEFTILLSDTEAVHKAGVLYSTDPAVPDDSPQATATGTDGLAYRVLLTGLEQATAYYAKAFVTDDKEANYSEIIPLNTLSTTYTNHTVAAARYAAGTGAPSDPYLISSAEHLKLFQQQVNNASASSGAFYRLTTDIVVTADEWTPIGNILDKTLYLKDSISFKGGFDGGGHAIRGLLRNGASEYFGFFGYLGAEASVSNLSLAAEVRHEVDFKRGDPVYVPEIYAGGIAGFSKAALSNCLVTGNVYGGSCTGTAYTGGIAGSSAGRVTDCEVNANVTGGKAASVQGGIAGCIAGAGSIINCKYAGTLAGTGSASDTGGIAGASDNNDPTRKVIQNCTVEAAITGSPGFTTGTSHTGGIVGSAVLDVIDCHVSGSINGGGAGNSYTGGIAGYLATCYSGSSESYAPGRIINCSNSASVTGGETFMSTGPDGYLTSASTGGIAGGNTGIINNCKSLGTVTGKGSLTGGIAGDSHFVDFGINGITSISNCRVEAPVTGEAFGDSRALSFTGGIAGENTGDISGCTLTASAPVSGYCKGNTGGIAGRHGYGSAGTIENYRSPVIDKCTNNAKVSGTGYANGYVGGIAGANHGIIRANLNTGDVSELTGLSYAGGLAGWNESVFNGTAVIYSCSINRGLVNGQPASAGNQTGGGEALAPCPDGQ
jgi:hypothetical protein